MSLKEPNSMSEVHQIRVKLHKEYKPLSPAQRIKKINESAQRFLKSQGLESRIVSRISVK